MIPPAHRLTHHHLRYGIDDAPRPHQHEKNQQFPPHDFTEPDVAERSEQNSEEGLGQTVGDHVETFFRTPAQHHPDRRPGETG